MATNVIDIFPSEIRARLRHVVDSGSNVPIGRYGLVCTKADFASYYTGCISYVILEKESGRRLQEFDTINLLEYDGEYRFSDRLILATITHVRPLQEIYEIVSFEVIGTRNIS